MTDTLKAWKDKMKNKIFTSKWLAYLGLVLVLLSFAAIVVLCILRGFSGMEATWVFNVGADVVSIAVCAVIYFGCLMDSNGVNENTALFNILVLVNAFALFFDAAAWIVQGVARYAFWNRLINALLYANGSVVVFLFWHYVTNTLEMDSRRMRAVEKILNMLLLPDVLIKLANVFYPIYFIVDEAGVYRRGTYFAFSYLYLAIVVYIFIVELIGSKVSFRKKIAAVSFIAIPILNQFLIGRIYGLSTQYVSTLLSIVLIHAVLFADRGKTLARTAPELHTAGSIQASLLPDVFPDCSDYAIYASMNPAREVGGDFYDFFLIDENHLCVVIADVAGKGIPASLFMMSSMIVLQNYALAGHSPARILEEANSRICATNKEGMFVTVWLGILDLTTGRMIAANAGHEYPVLHRRGRPFELLKDRHGFVVGGLVGMKYKEYELQLNAGDELFVYTDGVPEAANKTNELYGTERLLDALNRTDNASPEELLDAVTRDVDRFVGTAEQFDDLTMLCVRYLGRGQE